MDFLDDIPMASFVSVAAIVIIVIAYISNDLSVQDALITLGASLGGAGFLGHARNGAGRGMRK